MRIEQTFPVDAPADEVFVALHDLDRVVPCFPGARITDHDGEGTYHGEVHLGFSRLRGTVSITHSDRESRTLHLSTGHHHAVVTIADRDGAADVTASADLSEIGGLALFGGLVQDLSGRLLRDFGACLSRKLSEPTGADITAGREAPEAALADPPPPDPDQAAG